MASRQEEKARRREERLAQERAAAKAASRRKRLQYAFGGLLGAGALAGVTLLLVLGLDGGGGAGAEPGAPQTPEAGAAIPPQRIGELRAAAEAAGCELKSPEIAGSTHETKAFQASDYDTNPPTAGNHSPDWYEDGIYEPGGVPELGMTVHALEHGRVNVQYKAGTPANTVQQLEALLAEQSEGYHMLLFQNETDMPYAVAATAWGQLLGCKTMSDEVFDGLRTFRAQYVDKGPEAVP